MKTIIIIFITLVFAYSFHYSLDGIRGDFPVEYKDKYTVSPRCEICVPPVKCKPYISVEEPRVIALDSSPYLKTIKSLNYKISDLKNCIKEECINFSSMSSKCQ